MSRRRDDVGHRITKRDGAIALMATVQSLFNLPGRQTEGFLESLFALMGIDLPVPDHSTLSRRMGKEEVELPVTPSKGAIQVVVDSTGVKVYGEGEWKVRSSWGRQATDVAEVAYRSQSSKRRDSGGGR